MTSRNRAMISKSRAMTSRAHTIASGTSRIEECEGTELALRSGRQGLWTLRSGSQGLCGGQGLCDREVRGAAIEASG